MDLPNREAIEKPQAIAQVLEDDEKRNHKEGPSLSHSDRSMETSCKGRQEIEAR
jgi:hypothetical protein